MAPYRAVDPELIGLLREVAVAERSALFDVTPEQLARSPLDAKPRVPNTSALLSNAERRLLETRREELGVLLYWYGHQVRTADPALAHTWHDSVTVDRELEPPTGGELAARAQRLATAGGLDTSDVEAVACLRRCLGGGAESPAKILVAALRVAPSDSMRMCLGADLYTSRRPISSARVLRDLLESRPAALVASYALEELGFQACSELRYPEAALHYEQAALADAGRVMPLVFWLFAAVQAGEPVSAARAAARIDELAGPEHSAVRWFVSGHLADRTRGGWAPTRAADACRSALAQVGPAAMEVLSVFA
jgi:hypothetical protein